MARRPSNILSHCRLPPRPCQVDALHRIEEVWPHADVTVVSAPTGAGKSLLAETIVRWVASTNSTAAESSGLIAVPNNLLLNQYTSTKMPGFDSIKRRDLYTCHEAPDRGWTCEERRQQIGAACRSPDGNPYHEGACPYVAAVRKAQASPKFICTAHAMLAHKLKRDVVVFDEAHGLIDILRDLSAVRLWRREFGWGGRLEEPEDVIRWLSDELPSSAHNDRTDLLWRCMTGARPTHILDASSQRYHGADQECLSLLPLDVRASAGLLFSRTRKIILMSATIGPRDVAALGLDRMRVAHIDVESPIPAAQRPVEFVPVADMRFINRTESVQTMARWIVDEYLPAWSGRRGLIHATYAVAEALRDAIGMSSRLMFHGHGNKSSVLDDFLRIDGPGDERVLVGSGMEEGLDLAGDLARFQLITSTPRASVSDPAVAWLARNQPDQYEWETIRKLVQASGRVSRGPDDWGVTTIADSSAQMELQSTQLPRHFVEALQAGRARSI